MNLKSRLSTWQGEGDPSDGQDVHGPLHPGVVRSADRFRRVGDLQAPSHFDGHDHSTGTEALADRVAGIQE